MIVDKYVRMYADGDNTPIDTLYFGEGATKIVLRTYADNVYTVEQKGTVEQEDFGFKFEYLPLALEMVVELMKEADKE